MAVLFLIFLDQICPKWIKLDQSGFLTNLKMLLHPSKLYLGSFKYLIFQTEFQPTVYGLSVNRRLSFIHASNNGLQLLKINVAKN